MKKIALSESLEITFDGMLEMQTVIDSLPDKMPKSDADKLKLWIAKNLYKTNWVLYQILLELRKGG